MLSKLNPSLTEAQNRGSTVRVLAAGQQGGGHVGHMEEMWIQVGFQDDLDLNIERQ